MSRTRIEPEHLRVVGISELAVSADPDEVLVTYSLGSCLGLALYDGVRRIGGLIHCMLPLASIDPDKARQRPAMFVDTGVTGLLDRLFELGAKRDALVVKVAGGASRHCGHDSFRIGERNLVVLRKVLWKNDLLITGSAVGGCDPRTLTLHMADGTTTVRTGEEETPL